jgi:broad specificity phosphatase PhoE
MSPVITANVSDDVAERIEEQREGKGDEKESRSAAVDRLIRAGLDQREREGGVYVTHGAAITFLGWLLVAGAFFEVERSVGTLGFGIIAVGIVYSIADRRGWI